MTVIKVNLHNSDPNGPANSVRIRRNPNYAVFLDIEIRGNCLFVDFLSSTNYADIRIRIKQIHLYKNSLVIGLRRQSKHVIKKGLIVFSNVVM